MRPTPAEAIAGIRRILRDVVEPEVGSDYARSRLREVRAVLAQIAWDDAVPRVRAETETHRRLLTEIRAWVHAGPERASHFGDVDDSPSTTDDESFSAVNAARADVAARLCAAVGRLDEWCRAHPDDHGARELRLRLIRTLAR